MALRKGSHTIINVNETITVNMVFNLLVFLYAIKFFIIFSFYLKYVKKRALVAVRNRFGVNESYLG